MPKHFVSTFWKGGGGARRIFVFEMLGHLFLHFQNKTAHISFPDIIFGFKMINIYKKNKSFKRFKNPEVKQVFSFQIVEKVSGWPKMKFAGLEG